MPLLLFSGHIAQSAEPEVRAMEAKLACPSLLATWPLWILFTKNTYHWSAEAVSPVVSSVESWAHIRALLPVAPLAFHPSRPEAEPEKLLILRWLF